MASESWVVDGPQVIEVDLVRGVRIQLVGGRVDVVAHDGPGARVEVEDVVGRPLEVVLDGTDLHVGYGTTLGGWERFVERVATWNGRDRATVHLAVPRDAAVQLGTVSADGLLAGVEEDATVATVSGAVVVDGTRGRLSASTVSGEVSIRGHAGDLHVNTVSGDVTAEGELRLVQSNAVSGALLLDVTAPTSSVTANSVSGEVTVRLPAGRGLRVQSRTATGRLVVDGQEHRGSSGNRSAEVLTGDGTCHVTVTTVSGPVTVLHAAPVAGVQDSTPGAS